MSISDGGRDFRRNPFHSFQIFFSVQNFYLNCNGKFTSIIKVFLRTEVFLIIHL